MNALEILVNIVNIVFESFCVSYTLMIILCFINKGEKYHQNKNKFIKFWLLNMLAVALSSLIHTLLPDYKWIKSLIILSAFPISAYVTYKTKIYKGIIGTVVLLASSAILEIITVLVIQALDINPYAIVNNIYYNCMYSCLLALCDMLIISVIYKLTTISNHSLASGENKLKYFVPQLVAIVICMFPTMALLMFNYFKYSALFIVINLLQLLVVSFVGIYNLKFVAKHENTELELANTIIYNQTLKKVNDGVRGFKHDMGNIVQAILGYIAINDSEGAKKYCQNLVIGFNDINILSILSPKVIDDPAIYGVVVNKILVARDKNLTLSLDINTSVANINFPKFELSRILGILLDNAIEAGEQTTDKKLILNMHHDYQRNVDVVVISNSIENTDIDVEKIFTKNYSTKQTPSGFGLYEVTKFLKRNPQGYIVTSIDKGDKMFTQTLTIDSNIQLLEDFDNIKESTVA